MQIIHRTQAGTATYDTRGITLRPRFGKTELRIPWSEIDFFSPTPALRHTDAGWTDFRGRPVDTLDRLLLEPAVRNRQQLQLQGWYARLWWRRFELHPLLGADDEPLPRAGYFRLEVRLSTLSVPRAVFFDFLTTHSRFDLIVHL